jgi:hypothetical protein
MSIEAMKQLIEDMISMMEYHVEQTRPIHTTTVALQAAKDALKKIEQSQQVDKEGSPCPEFWDWLPKAYNFDGDGAFTKYNMEVAFFAGKQAIEQAQKQEPVTIWYMRDNHTFKKLSEDVSTALIEIEQEFNEGHTYGMLCSKRKGFPSVHASGDKKRLEFFAECKATLEQWLPKTSPPPRQPLTDAVTKELWHKSRLMTASQTRWQVFKKLIEAAHGITKENT